MGTSRGLEMAHFLIPHWLDPHDCEGLAKAAGKSRVAVFLARGGFAKAEPLTVLGSIFHGHLSRLALLCR